VETVAVYGQTPCDRERLRSRLGMHWVLPATTSDQIVIEEASGCIYLHVAGPNVRTDDWLGDHALFIDYSGGGLALVKKILYLIADDPSLVVDTDFAAVMPGDRIAERIRSEPDWDWRTASSD